MSDSALHLFLKIFKNEKTATKKQMAEIRNMRFGKLWGCKTRKGGIFTYGCIPYAEYSVPRE